MQRQSARMSKITNEDGLTRSGTGCFIAAVPKGLMKVRVCDAV